MSAPQQMLFELRAEALRSGCPKVAVRPPIHATS
jgi:hypothetical protein